MIFLPENATLKPPPTVSEDCKLWVDVLKDNRKLVKGLVMSYVARVHYEDGVEVEIEDDDMISELLF